MFDLIGLTNIGTINMLFTEFRYENDSNSMRLLLVLSWISTKLRYDFDLSYNRLLNVAFKNKCHSSIW